MALLVAKVPFWKGPQQGRSAENTSLIVLSAKHSFAEIKECKFKKTEIYQE